MAYKKWAWCSSVNLNRAGTMPERFQLFCRRFKKGLNVSHRINDEIFLIMPRCAGTMPERSQLFCRHFQKGHNSSHRSYNRFLLIMPERAGTMPECWAGLHLKAELYFVS
jgi:hypothetical protein